MYKLNVDVKRITKVMVDRAFSGPERDAPAIHAALVYAEFRHRAYMDAVLHMNDIRNIFLLSDEMAAARQIVEALDVAQDSLEQSMLVVQELTIMGGTAEAARKEERVAKVEAMHLVTGRDEADRLTAEFVNAAMTKAQLARIYASGTSQPQPSGGQAKARA